jgi:hypothetical protein
MVAANWCNGLQRTRRVLRLAVGIDRGSGLMPVGLSLHLATIDHREIVPLGEFLAHDLHVVLGVGIVPP